MNLAHIGLTFGGILVLLILSRPFGEELIKKRDILQGV
ncbi:MAG: hypothetical protein ACI815_001909 [Psychroserpens sp.]|jgi:hypothetical protein